MAHVVQGIINKLNRGEELLHEAKDEVIAVLGRFVLRSGPRDGSSRPDRGARCHHPRASVRTTINDLLAGARRGLERLDPTAACQAIRSGATLIDIRAEAQIAADGVVPGALVVPRNVLEWRMDPASGHRHPRAPGLEDQVILMCDEGDQSSLAAATLQRLGFARATDLDGGFQAWRGAGLPVERG